MDEISNKALLIATGLFVTLIITSSVLFIIDQIKNIYSQVYETNISLQDRFNEFEEYDNTTKTGIDVLNTVKKYRDVNNVDIVVIKDTNKDTLDTVDLKKGYIANNSLDGDKLDEDKLQEISEIVYVTTMQLNEDTGSVTITFTKK